MSSMLAMMSSFFQQTQGIVKQKFPFILTLNDFRYFWDKMPYYEELNRFLLFPNSGHGVTTRLLTLVPSISAWMSNIIVADQLLTRRSGPRKLSTIDDRNLYTQEIMSVANIPKFNWTIDPENGDIIVNSEVSKYVKSFFVIFPSYRFHQLRLDYGMLFLAMKKGMVL